MNPLKTDATLYKQTVLAARLLFVFGGSAAVLWFPVTVELVLLMLVSFFVRTFGWEAGHHRYFAHRSFKTGRVFQFVLGALGAMSGQRGPLWWAAVHREHHSHSDTDHDPHSPLKRGRFFAYLGWLFERPDGHTNYDNVRDWAQHPELVWLNEHHYIFPYCLLLACFAVGQWTPLFGWNAGVETVIWGFCLSTLLSLQGTHLVNALAHAKQSSWFTYRSYETDDRSQNHWLLCVLTLGASWHNNHHRYPAAARAGFRWWELDLTYLILRGLAGLGIVWDLRTVPGHILEEPEALLKPRA
jgi:stearoyl-CoA desaturase (delta-9 desaturase)